MAAGEIDVFGKLMARTAAGKICDAEQVDGLDEKIAAAITPPEKEVISVLTASDTAPGSPAEDDLWIDTANNNLSKYNGLIWVRESPSTEVVYITLDTSDIYVWSGTEFICKTGEAVDNFIPVVSLDSGIINDYDEQGMWTVCYIHLEDRVPVEVLMYNLSVSKATKDNKKFNILQVLSNEKGYRSRSRVDRVLVVGDVETTIEGRWSSWSTYTYASESYVNTKVSTEATERSNADTAEATARAAADDEILDLLYACF